MPGDLEMLAGNLASIGVGGIIACVSSYFVRLPSPPPPSSSLTPLPLSAQWPEDFNFDITRAINAPRAEPAECPKPASVELDEKKAPSVATEVLSVRAAEADAELDPAGLQRAFRFAAWSSVVLVRVPPPCGNLCGC